MIGETISYFSSLLSDYIERLFRIENDRRGIKPPSMGEKGAADNKIHHFLLQMEVNSGAGAGFHYQAGPCSADCKTNPFWHLNRYFVIVVEAFNLPFGELWNLWSILGSQYPPVLCKVRPLLTESREIKHTGRTINQKDVSI